MPVRTTAKTLLLCAVLFAAAAQARDQGTRFADCLAGLREDARAHGIGAAEFDRFLAGVQPDPSVVEARRSQPEFVTPIWDYLAALVDAERIADGRERLAQHAPLLARIAAEYGVDAETVIAVWGVESDYGRVRGKRPLLQSFISLICAGQRAEFFRGELWAALAILRDGDVAPEKLVGSWAGAFGQTQFMPSTYRRLAVDFDGDGRRDLVDSDADALASTANYLAQSGWRRGQRWGFEVRVPDGFDARAAGCGNRHPVSHWVRRGVVRIDGGSLVGDDAPVDRAAALLLPAGPEGPAFIVFRNYDAIYSYNAAESYALAIALLSDALRGSDGPRAGWPTDDPGLSRIERRELQQLLAARGHDIGEIDGLIGPATRSAIALEQTRLGLAVDSRAGRRLLRALRSD